MNTNVFIKTSKIYTNVFTHIPTKMNTNVFVIPYYNSLTQLKTKFCLKCQ